MTWPVLFWPVLTWPVLIWPVLTWPVLTCPTLTIQVLTYQITIGTSRHPPDSFHTPTRQSPKFRQVGALPLLKAKWGFLLPSSFLLLPWENKVNSYSNQLKLSWVCMLEWSLTISFLIQPILLWEPHKSKMAARGPQNCRRGLEKGPPLGFWALPSTFAK